MSPRRTETCGATRSLGPCSQPGCGGKTIARCGVALGGRLEGKTCDRLLCVDHGGAARSPVCPPHVAWLADGGKIFRKAGG